MANNKQNETTNTAAITTTICQGEDPLKQLRLWMSKKSTAVNATVAIVNDALLAGTAGALNRVIKKLEAIKMSNDEQIETTNTSMVDPLKQQLRLWMSKNSTVVNATGAAINGALTGADAGVVVGTVFSAVSTFLFPLLPPGSIHPQFVSYCSQAFGGGPLVQALKYATMIGVSEGASCLLKKKEDDITVTCMKETFARAVMVSLVTGFGMGNPNRAADVLEFGLVIAVVHTALSQGIEVIDEFNKCNQYEENNSFATTKNMLASFGLQHFENNFKNASLSDITQPPPN